MTGGITRMIPRAQNPSFFAAPLPARSGSGGSQASGSRRPASHVHWVTFPARQSCKGAEGMTRRGLCACCRWRGKSCYKSVSVTVSEATLLQLVCKKAKDTVAWAEWSAASFMRDPAGGTGYSSRNSQARPRWSTPASMCWRSNRAPSSRMRSLTQSSISSHS